jgi:O-6-methylguanine DNA methyltransferase
LEFPSGRAAGLPAREVAPREIHRWHRLTAAGVKRALAGEEPGELPPLDLSGGTKFQRSVWEAMRRIRVGQTRSYGELAREIGKPNAMRAVGGACGANPIPVLVPCHRVVAAGRKLGGFSGGLNWKLRLLACEGVELPLD